MPPEELAKSCIAKWRSHVESTLTAERISIVDGQLFHGNLTSLLLLEADEDMKSGDFRAMSALPSTTDLREMNRNVRKVPENETARAVGRCGMAVPAIDGTIRASYLMMMRGQKQIVQHDDLAISSTVLGAHRT
jgi:hypothetical protein